MRLCWIASLMAGTCGVLASATPGAASDRLEIVILYDNTSTRPDARANWGFSALVTYRGETVLFDSGAKPDILLANMKALAVNPESIRQAVISHPHGDHLNGIYSVFPFQPKMKVHLLASFPAEAFDKAGPIGMKPERHTGPVRISDGIYSTGPVEGDPPEQALVIETAKGLVVITGCSHPGVAKIVEAAERQRGTKSVRLLLGGFHMLQHSEAETLAVIDRLRALGVESISATHCTGEMPIRLFAKAYGDKAVVGGAGKRIVLD